MSDSALDRLRTELGREWPAIAKARDDARREKLHLQQILTNGKQRLEPADSSIVIFGSLAREEWTSGSDLDWTLLIDGQVDPAHQRNALEIDALLEREGYKK